MGDGRRELTCREVVELVNDDLDGALTAHELARFKQHLSSCDGCDRYVNQMRLTIQTVQRLRREDVPARTRDELLDRFRRWKRRDGST
jgi:predicted anti-sigma-YlaC factor YlaD